MKKKIINFPALLFFILISLTINAQNSNFGIESSKNKSPTHHPDSILADRIEELTADTSAIKEHLNYLGYLENEYEIDAYEYTVRIKKCSYAIFFRQSYFISSIALSNPAIPYGFDGNIRAVNSLGYGNMYSRGCLRYSALDFINGGNRGAYDLGVNFFDSERFRKIAQLYSLNDLTNNPYHLATLNKNNNGATVALGSNSDLPSTTTSTSQPKGSLSRGDQSSSNRTLAYNDNNQKGTRSQSRFKRRDRPAKKNISHRNVEHISHKIPERKNVNFAQRTSITPSRTRSSSNNTGGIIP